MYIIAVVKISKNMKTPKMQFQRKREQSYLVEQGMTHYILDANVLCGHKTMVCFEITNIYHTVYMNGIHDYMLDSPNAQQELHDT